MPISRGEIYMLYLDPSFGRELGGYKVRPVAVVSINFINNHRSRMVVTVVPGTSATKVLDHKNVAVIAPTESNGLRNPTGFQAHQIRALIRGGL